MSAMTYRPDHERYHQHGRSTDMDPLPVRRGPEDEAADMMAGPGWIMPRADAERLGLCRPDQYPPYPPMAQPSPRTHAHIADPDKYRALRARILGMVEPS